MTKYKKRRGRKNRVEDNTYTEESSTVDEVELDPLVARTTGQARFLEMLSKYDVVVCDGPAGTGKTFLSIATALHALLTKQEVSKLILTRPVVEAGEKLGYLPGDFKEKLDPYLRPMYDALWTLIGVDRYRGLLGQEIIEIAPLAYMRGRTLSNAFIILDEAQNTTLEQIIMTITRLGPGSRLIINGDSTQIDLPKHKESGLIKLQEILISVPSIGFYTFTEADVVRHPIVKDVVTAYQGWKAKN